MTTGASHSLTTLPKRSELDPRYTWDLDVLCPSIDEFGARFGRVSTKLEELEGFRGRLGESAEVLLAGLRLRDELLMDVELLYEWAGLRASEDTKNATYGALDDRCAGLTARGAA